MGRAIGIGAAVLTALAVLVSPAAAAGPDRLAQVDLRGANLIFYAAVTQNPRTFGPYTERTTGGEGGSVETTTTQVRVGSCFYRYTRGLTGWWCPILLRQEESRRPPGAAPPVQECSEATTVWKISELLPRPGSALASTGVFAKARLGRRPRRFFLVGVGPHPGYPPGFPRSQPCA
jgi:hypothetical protein